MPLIITSIKYSQSIFPCRVPSAELHPTFPRAPASLALNTPWTSQAWHRQLFLLSSFFFLSPSQLFRLKTLELSTIVNFLSPSTCGLSLNSFCRVFTPRDLPPLAWFRPSFSCQEGSSPGFPSSLTVFALFSSSSCYYRIKLLEYCFITFVPCSKIPSGSPLSST